MPRAMTTKTKHALALFDANPEKSAFRCAIDAGLSPSALYAAIKQREASTDGLCPACRQPLTKKGTPQ